MASDEVFSVALDANASRIVSGSGDGTIKIWNAGSGEEIRTLKGHKDEVKAVAFSPDGKLWTAIGWKPNGEKCPVTNAVDGNGVMVFYNEHGTEDSRHTF